MLRNIMQCNYSPAKFANILWRASIEFERFCKKFYVYYMKEDYQILDSLRDFHTRSTFMSKW